MTTLERIKAELLDEGVPRPVLLLGAGASIKSGVPSAAGFAEMIARSAYLRDQGRSENDQSVHRSDWLPWLKSFSWYDADTPPEHQYPTLVERLLTPRETRMQFFVERVRAAPRPSNGYVALADLIAKGWFRTVLTTNFDDLIEQACRANPRALLMTIRSPGEAGNISTTPRFAQLVFLHGTVEHYTDLNLTSETQHLSEALVAALTPLLRDSPIVVIGYRGAEPSIMRDLLISRAAEWGAVSFGPVTRRGGDYFGSVISLVSRATKVAVPGAVVATTEVVRAIAADLLFTEIGHHELRGVGGPVLLYEVKPREGW